MKTLGVLLENGENESRVSMVPEVIKGIIKEGLTAVLVEKDAGRKAGFFDEDYINAGAKIACSREEVITSSDCLLAIDGLQLGKDVALENKVIIGLFDPFFNQEAIKALCERGATLVSLELLPRISRAQSMDVLSSQANIAGYVAVIKAADKLGKIMPMMMTAAGTIKAAKVLVIGAGVAGLSAISTAKRLGAMVFGYDVRSVVKEQVESLGAKFVEIKIEEGGEGGGGYAKALSEKTLSDQRGLLANFAKDMDIIITTAQIPGRKAPLLLEREIFSKLKNDSVIIDLAANSGGNVEGSVPNIWQRMKEVWLYGGDNLSRFAPKDASFTFSKNLKSLLDLLDLNSQKLDLADEILAESILCHDKKWVSKIFYNSIKKD